MTRFRRRTIVAILAALLILALLILKLLGVSNPITHFMAAIAVIAIVVCFLDSIADTWN